MIYICICIYIADIYIACLPCVDLVFRNQNGPLKQRDEGEGNCEREWVEVEVEVEGGGGVLKASGKRLNTK
jgi:hypothetical protein